MKKLISVLLSICIVLGVCGVSGFAQEGGTAKALDKIEITVTTNEFYSDLAVSDCMYYFYTDHSALDGVDFQKNIDGEWQTLDYDSSEPIGTGMFRIMFVFDNYEYDSGKVEPGVTHLYIDGVDSGAVDENYRAYSQTFELTEDDKVPEPQIIDEIRVDGFKAPAAGEKRQYADDLTIVCKGAEDANPEFYFNITETNLRGNQNTDFETYSGGCRYTLRFNLYILSYKYEIADDCVLCLGDEKIDLDIERTSTGSFADTSVDYIISRLPGDLGALEDFIGYFIILKNVIQNRTRFLIGDFLTEAIDNIAYLLINYIEKFAYNLDYFLGLDELERVFFFV